MKPFSCMRLVALAACLVPTGIAFGDHAYLKFEARLSTAQAVPDPAPGQITDSTIKVYFDDALSEITVIFKVDGGENVATAHLHCGLPGERGPIVVSLFSPGPLHFDGYEARGQITQYDFSGTNQGCEAAIGRPVNNIAALAFAMREGLIYAEVHTLENLLGEVRGQLLQSHFK